MIVRIEHVRSIRGFGQRPGFCASKSREWFVRHGLDWSEFLRSGIDSAVLEATGDGLALALVAHAKQQETEANGQQ